MRLDWGLTCRGKSMLVRPHGMLQNSIKLLKKFTRSLSFKLSFYAGLLMFFALLAFSYHSITSQERHAIDKMMQAALKDSEVIKAAIREGMVRTDEASGKPG